MRVNSKCALNQGRSEASESFEGGVSEDFTCSVIIIIGGGGGGGGGVTSPTNTPGRYGDSGSETLSIRLREHYNFY
jgi:hypothetical protein